MAGLRESGSPTYAIVKDLNARRLSNKKSGTIQRVTIGVNEGVPKT